MEQAAAGAQHLQVSANQRDRPRDSLYADSSEDEHPQPNPCKARKLNYEAHTMNFDSICTRVLFRTVSEIELYH
jgi:nitrous oxidase accessory protein NosD